MTTQKLSDAELVEYLGWLKNNSYGLILNDMAIAILTELRASRAAKGKAREALEAVEVCPECNMSRYEATEALNDPDVKAWLNDKENP